RSDGNPLTSAHGFSLFEQARQTGKPTLDVRISRILQRPVFAFGAPVIDAGGHFAGLVAGSVEATRIADVLATAGSETHGTAYLVDSTGRAIAHPDTGLVSSFASLVALPPVAAFIHSPESGALRYGTGATETLAAYALVPGYGWGVIVERPVTDA